MKKILLTTIAAGCSFAAFGQGSVTFENFNMASASINFGPTPGNQSPAPFSASAGAPGFTVALLWFNGSSFQTIDVFQSSAASSGGFAGAFNAGTISVPTFSATGTFEVQGWYNASQNFTTYAAAAAAAGSYVGTTASFTATEVTPPSPAPILNTGGGGGSWNGDLNLTPVPEPTTIALGGLGAAALLLFRRRK